MERPCLVFGFGSLINSHSRARTLGPVPAWPVRVAGLQRGFIAPSQISAHTAMGVRRVSHASCNGVLALLPADRLASLDARESQYMRASLHAAQCTALADPWPEGDIVTYVPKAPAPPSPSHPVLRSYLDVILSGCLEFGEAFARELLTTTDHIGPFLEDDRAAPRYPLHEAHAPRGLLDALVAAAMGP